MLIKRSESKPYLTPKFSPKTQLTAVTYGHPHPGCILLGVWRCTLWRTD
jgi:hypothetical protein